MGVPLRAARKPTKGANKEGTPKGVPLRRSAEVTEPSIVGRSAKKAREGNSIFHIWSDENLPFCKANPIISQKTKTRRCDKFSRCFQGSRNQELRVAFQTTPEYIRKKKGSENVIARSRIDRGRSRSTPIPRCDLFGNPWVESGVGTQRDSKICRGLRAAEAQNR